MTTSKPLSFEGFDLKTFIFGFKKPAVMLIAFAVTTLTKYPEFAGIIVALGGTGVLAERIWAIVEFYVKEVKL